MKVGIVLGTRPEIIKMSSVIHELENQGIDYFLLHSSQHYSHKMDSLFFNQLNLKIPKYRLNIGGMSHGKQTGTVIIKAESIYMSEKPDVVIVHGDTNTTIGGALAAVKICLVGHLEAGLRSFDRNMPEEINRIVVDHLSDICFSPTETAKQNLLAEGVEEERIKVTGNTIVDTVLSYSKESNGLLEKLELNPRDYLVLTLHRPSNVDSFSAFNRVIDGINKVAEDLDKQVVFPIHPRTRKNLKENKIKFSNRFILTDPIGYIEFLELLKESHLVMTDSGGIQEEACILKIPCITLRENTERPETIDIGANILGGVNASSIFAAYKKINCRSRDWENPFGDGNASVRVIDVLKNLK